jgi:hypothetical protein
MPEKGIRIMAGTTLKKVPQIEAHFIHMNTSNQCTFALHESTRQRLTKR